MSEKRIRGIGASAGIVEGKAHVLNRRKAKFNKRYIAEEYVEQEVVRVREAIEKSKQDLKKIKEAMAHENIHEHIYILDSHLMVLEDAMLLDAVTDMIVTQKRNGEWALLSVFEDFKRMFNVTEDHYLKERQSDFDYLINWILKHLSGRKESSIQKIECVGSIIVAHYLSPADTAQMDGKKVVGFVTDIGGKTSHTAILARALKIPAVVGLERATQEVQNGDRVILDGREGLLIINPSPETRKYYRNRQQQYGNFERALLGERELPAETSDGRRVRLTANIEMVEEASSVIEYGAHGIGLFRTEFLCLSQGRIPNEEEHFHFYKRVVEQVAPRPVTIRTFDFGSDKSPIINNLSQEGNPTLGLRSIRYCLKEGDIFKDQLRAVLRASHYGKVKILFPMISGLSELIRAKEILQEAREEVRRRGESFDPEMEVGIMVEVPSAAIIADILAKEVDFFSIGTNDLIQYSLAIDRVNKEVAYLYEPLHPAILRLLKNVADCGHKEGISVGMCGEMASDLRYIFVLLGFGFDQLSMVSSMIPWIKNIVRSSCFRDAEALVAGMLGTESYEENEKVLSDWIRERGPDINATLFSVTGG